MKHGCPAYTRVVLPIHRPPSCQHLDTRFGNWQENLTIHRHTPSHNGTTRFHMHHIYYSVPWTHHQHIKAISRHAAGCAETQPLLPPPVAYARFQSILWYLYASTERVQSIKDTKRLHIHCFFLHHHHGKSTMWHTQPHKDTLYKTYTRGLREALDAKDLGRWRELLQAQVVYKTHPIIHMLRATS